MNRAWAPLCAGLAMLSLLGGCAAVVAIPVLAGGAMVAGGNLRIRAATPNPTAGQRLAARGKTAGAPILAPAESREGLAGEPGALGGEALDAAAPTPTPTPVSDNAALAPEPWRAFVDYAIDQVESSRAAEARSALLVANPSLTLPRLRDCTAPDRAVIVDLDPQEAAFAAAPGATARPGVAASLARLRAAGIVVLWITQRPAADVAQVADALLQSGLDPDGNDPLLLVRSPSDRKQLLRQEANEDVCVIAMAGDRKGDFDELFDYLRDPNSASGLDSLLGSGWFLVPLPFE